MRFDLSVIGTFSEIKRVVREILGEWNANQVESSCGNDKFDYVFTDCNDLHINNDHCEVLKPELPIIKYTNEVFQIKKPYQIAGALSQAIEALQEPKGFLFKKDDVKFLSQFYHDIAIDICTMTEYLHHVREGRENHTLIDMAIGITSYGSTNTEFTLLDETGKMYCSGTTGFSFGEGGKGVILKPEIFEPYAGYGMQWKSTFIG